jgi:UDP-N-acetyl-D-mannosaminuronate dehydrogenase
MTSACATRAHEVVAARLTDAEIHVVSSPEAAELTKLHENTFRAVNLALANEFAEICSALRIDPIEVIGRRRGHDLPSGRSGRRQDDHG